MIHPTTEPFKDDRRVVDMLIAKHVRHNGEDEAVDLYLVHAANHPLPPLADDHAVREAVMGLQQALGIGHAEGLGIVGHRTLAAVQGLHDQSRET